jgi:hypothetical protein
MSVFVPVGGVGMVVSVLVGGIPVGICVGLSLFVSARGVPMGILVGVLVYVPLSVGSRVGDGVVDSRYSLVMG